MSSEQDQAKNASSQPLEPDGDQTNVLSTRRVTGNDLAKKQTFNEHPNFGKGKHRINDDAVNHLFRRKLWEGQVPIKITLNGKDISSNKNPRSLYMMVPRLNYFTICLEKIKAFFDEYVPADLADG